jgi:signal transduction histidine kinase
MGQKVKCWEFFECDKTECPVYESKALKCWLVTGTHCRSEIQGKYLEKMEMCLHCEPFLTNMDFDSMEETIKVVAEQFGQFRKIVAERDSELKQTSLELAVGLSEVFEGLKRISSADPRVRISEESELELISKLKHMVNITAGDLGQIVDLSHEFAMGLAEHFGALDGVRKGDLNARVNKSSQVELLESLKHVTNEMIGSVSKEIMKRKRAEEHLKRETAELEESNQKVEEFAYMISHELQEPLRAVVSYLRLLELRCKDKLDEEADGHITSAIDGANRMQALIDELLGYSRMAPR